MKHGPNALIDETLPVVVIATKDPADPASVLKYEKTLSNIQEVTARSGRVIAIATELLLPILEVVPPPTPRLPHRRPPRLRRRPAEESSEERDGGIALCMQ
jgi:fructoselysine-6-P-deglycase FrlB-like protein